MAVSRKRIPYILLRKRIDSAGFQPFFEVPIKPNSSNRVDIELVAEEVGHNNHAVFKRVINVTRKTNNAQVTNFWHAVETIKSHKNIDISYSLAEGLKIFVKNSGSIPTWWKGLIRVLENPI